jgi:hypothetical protein
MNRRILRFLTYSTERKTNNLLIINGLRQHNSPRLHQFRIGKLQRFAKNCNPAGIPWLRYFRNCVNRRFYY